MEQGIESIQVNKVCRLCLTELKLTNDAMILNENQRFSALISELLSIEIPQDAPPDYHLCYRCESTLSEFDEFRNKCHKNDIIFRRIYQNESDTYAHPLELVEITDNIKTENDREYEEHKPREDIDLPKEKKPRKRRRYDAGEKTVKIPCHQCGKMISKTNMATHLATHQQDRPRFPCDHCDKHFSCYQNLKKHINTHTKDILYPCEHCGRCFYKKYTLTKHIKVVHTEERNHICSTCSKACATEQALTAHMNAVHPSVKLECEHCSKLFNTNSLLKIHMMIHTGDRPFRCEKCAKGFCRAYGLKIHLKNHHSGES